MTTSRTLICLALGVCLALGMSLNALAGQSAAEQSDQAVVAEISGRKLTRADLEQRKSAKLLQARAQYYQAEREALEQLIDEELVAERARRENLTVNELLQRDVIGQVKDPTEDQLQVFYEGMKSNEQYPAVREKIVNTIRQIRLTKLRAAYLESLRSQAAVRISLTPPKVDVDADSSPRRGPADAPVLIVEFADYECPYCQHIVPDLKKLQEEFPGKVALAFKDMPLPMHKNAQKAAEAARCANDQGKFWEFHDTLFANAQKLEPAHLKEYARSLKLDAARFDRCFDSGERAAAVKADLAQAQQLGLSGTPSLFINGRYLSGAVRYSMLREIVEQELATPATSAEASVSRRND